jgi:magnesium transporter
LLSAHPLQPLLSQQPNLHSEAKLMASHNLKLTIHFFSEEPIAAARKLDLMSADNAAAILQKVPISVVCKVIYAMLPSVAAKVLILTLDDFNRALFESIELADTAAILRYVNNKDRKRLIELIPKSRQALCQLLISYPENTVGALIETNVLVIDSQMTVAEAMLRVKKQTYFDNHEVLIVNSKRKIVGKLSIFDLLRAPASTTISALTSTSVITVNGLSDVSTVLEMDIWQKTDSISVVNRKKEFIGILRHYDLRASITRNKKTINVPTSVAWEMSDAFGSTLVSLTEILTQTK